MRSEALTRMAEIRANLPAARARGLKRWFEPTRIGRMSPAGSIIVYTLLILWSAFVLFPFYWLAVTSFKLPIDVFEGPSYLPWVDFTPNLHAWATCSTSARNRPSPKR